MISFEDCVEMAKAKLKYFIQSCITFECIELERCGLRRSHANLKGFNMATNFLKIGQIKPEILVKTCVKISIVKIVFLVV